MVAIGAGALGMPAMVAPRLALVRACAPPPPLGEMLADGLHKRTISGAPAPGAKTPTYGALAKVLFTVSFLNGTLVDEAYRSDPFEFQLDAGRVVEGLNTGVSTMVAGERAVFTCEPQWAHGPARFGGKVPAESTLAYEVELLEWGEGPPIDHDEFDLDAYKRDMLGEPVAKGSGGGEASASDGDREAVGEAGDSAYTWTERGAELVLRLCIPAETRAKHVDVEFRPRSVRIDAEGDASVSGELRGRVVPDECYWQIDDEEGGRELVVVLTKASAYTRWGGVFK